MLSQNFVFLCLLLAIYSTAVKTNSRWTSIMPMNAKTHGNVSIHRRDLRDFRFDANVSTYKMHNVYDDNSTEQHLSISPDGFLNKNPSVDRWPFIKLRRFRRTSEKKWMESSASASANVIKMQAFIVKDEEIPDCGTAVHLSTKTRYYVCSGTVLTNKHILTSATCMNKAVFHDYQIHAEVGALVGDLGQNSYVIKILDYTLHPDYDPNPASSVHELNNIAVMSLTCPIPDGKINFSQLPSSEFEDLAHVCCADKCSILTVFRLAHNRYTLQSMPAKHIPSFDKTHENAKENEQSLIQNDLLIRSMRGTNQFKINKQKDINGLLLRPNRDTSKKGVSTQRIADLPSHWTQIVEEISAGTVSKKSQDEMRNFLKISMTGLLEKIVNVLSTHVGDVANAYPYFIEAVNSENVTKKVEQSLMSYLITVVQAGDFLKEELKDDGNIQNGPDDESNVQKITNERTKLVDTAVRALDESAEKSKEKLEFFCPSIGTPVIHKSTVIGLIVYSCDEIQHWVSWKYVQTVHNTEWIRKQLKVVYYEKVDE